MKRRSAGFAHRHFELKGKGGAPHLLERSEEPGAPVAKEDREAHGGCLQTINAVMLFRTDTFGQSEKPARSVGRR